MLKNGKERIKQKRINRKKIPKNEVPSQSFTLDVGVLKMMAIFGGMVASPRTLTRPASIAWTRVNLWLVSRQKSSSLIVSTQYFGSGGGRPRSKTPVTLVLVKSSAEKIEEDI